MAAALCLELTAWELCLSPSPPPSQTGKPWLVGHWTEYTGALLSSGNRQP